MNWVRGLFRSWAVISLLWILVAGAIQWTNLTGYRTYDVAGASKAGYSAEEINSYLWSRQLHAATWIAAPPIGLLLLGLMATWAIRGFRQ
jgi:hypothetical protein